MFHPRHLAPPDAITLGKVIPVFNDECSNSVYTNSTDMTGTVLVEIVGLKDSECCPFPCDENRTCGLSDCYPTGKLTAAFDALAAELKKEYGDRVDLKLTLVDDGVPDYVKKIIETDYPPLPMVTGEWKTHPYRAYFLTG